MLKWLLVCLARKVGEDEDTEWLTYLFLMSDWTLTHEVGSLRDTLLRLFYQDAVSWGHEKNNKNITLSVSNTNPNRLGFSSWRKTITAQAAIFHFLCFRFEKCRFQHRLSSERCEEWATMFLLHSVPGHGFGLWVDIMVIPSHDS